MGDLFNGELTLDAAYDDIVRRIDSQLEGDRHIARMAITWVSCAYRPLNTAELRHALAFGRDDTYLDEDNIPDLTDVISVCAGLVVVDEASDVARLAHHTAQEYIAKVRETWMPGAQLEVALCCLTYLSFGEFKLGPCKSVDDFVERFARYPLLSYIASYLGEHIRPVQNDAWPKALLMMKDPQLVNSAFQASYTSFGGPSFSDYRPVIEGTHLAASLGLDIILRKLLGAGKNKVPNTQFLRVDEPDTEGKTPLAYAAGKGHESVVRLLLEEYKVNVGSLSSTKYTPLMQAVRNGHESVVKLFLSRDDADVNATNVYGMSALSLAAVAGHSGIVRLLTDTTVVDMGRESWEMWPSTLILAASVRQEDVARDILASHIDHTGVNDAIDGSGGTALHHVAAAGFESLVKLLLERGAAPNIADNNGRTPLIFVARTLLLSNDLTLSSFMPATASVEGAIKLLLSTGASNVAFKDKSYRTALSYAAESGQEGITKLILDASGVDINLKDYDGRTPLSYAAAKSSETNFRILLDAGSAASDVKDKKGRTPLSHAAEDGSDDIIRFLLNTPGIDVDSSDIDGKTPFSFAAQRSTTVAARLFLNTNLVDVGSRDQKGRTPLSYGAESGKEELVKLLLDTGHVNVDSADNSGRTPLSYAAEGGTDNLVKLFLDTGRVNVDAADESGLTPLMFAVGRMRSNATMVNLLIERGSDFAAVDNKKIPVQSHAARRGHLEIVEILIKNGAAVDVSDDYGRTPLFFATFAGNSSLVRLLLEHGANVFGVDSKGRTPLSMAEDFKNWTVVAVLSEWVMGQGLTINYGEYQ